MASLVENRRAELKGDEHSRHFSSLLALTVLAQGDAPQEVFLVPGSVLPQQQWPSDQNQIYEPLGSPDYCAEPTNAQALTNYGVWGHDEGPSVDTGTNVYWLWGDTVTAYPNSINPETWISYQLGNCGAGPLSCLGVDTISFVHSASSFSGCPHVPQLDFNLRNGYCLAHLAYPVGCPSATYITNTSHTSTQPKAAFNNDYVFGLSDPRICSAATPPPAHSACRRATSSRPTACSRNAETR